MVDLCCYLIKGIVLIGKMLVSKISDKGSSPFAFVLIIESKGV